MGKNWRLGSLIYCEGLGTRLGIKPVSDEAKEQDGGGGGQAYMYVLFLLQVKCMVLFVTHYPVLAKLEEAYPSSVGNFHMAYFEAEESS